MPTYRVVVTAIATVVVVGAKNQQEAEEVAIDETSKLSLEIEEAKVDEELKSDAEIAMAIRQSDEVLDDWEEAEK